MSWKYVSKVVGHFPQNLKVNITKWNVCASLNSVGSLCPISQYSYKSNNIFYSVVLFQRFWRSRFWRLIQTITWFQTKWWSSFAMSSTTPTPLPHHYTTISSRMKSDLEHQPLWTITCSGGRRACTAAKPGCLSWASLRWVNQKLWTSDDKCKHAVLRPGINFLIPWQSFHHHSFLNSTLG